MTAAGSIVVIRFKRPVEIPVGRLSDAVPDYISSARADPDGAAIRLSLARKVTVNTMTAGERVFVDFLPDNWSGAPPGLPQEVVRELSERARAAERALRLQRANAEAKKRPPVRVRASVQPTFVRFVFEMPDGIGVSSVLNEQKLTLLFNAPLTFDLADAKVAAPPNVASINQKIDGASSTVEAELIGDVDVRSFREDKNYVVDVAFQRGKAADRRAARIGRACTDRAGQPLHRRRPPDPAPATQPVPHAGEVTPPTSETIAQQAKIEIKPEINRARKDRAAATAARHAIAEGSPGRDRRGLEAGAVSHARTRDGSSKTCRRRKFRGSRQRRQIGKARGTARQRRPAADISFAQATPAALFRRADAVWLVFDSTKPLDVEPIRAKGGALIGDVNRLDLPQGQAIRLRLNRPQIPSLTGSDAGNEWTVTFADTMQAPPQPLMAIRNITDPALANVTVPLAKPGLMHRFTDPDAGDNLMVVTAPLPVRGFIKRQDFVELSLLESIHGVAVHPNSDDVKAEIATDKILLGRPGGLTLSSADVAAERANLAVRPIFDIGEWREHQAGNFLAREDALIKAMGAAAPDVRPQARLDLARFYMARGLYPEAKGVADLVLSEVKPGFEESAALMLRAVANILIGRPEQALKDFASPGDRHQLRYAIVAGACGGAPRANGRKRAKNSRMSNSRSHPCRSSCSASC